jgi:hypothetical protein
MAGIATGWVIFKKKCFLWVTVEIVSSWKIHMAKPIISCRNGEIKI